MKIAVVGLGHVGLVTAAVLAQAGHDVLGTDIDPDRVAVLNDGECPFFEPGLDKLLDGPVYTENDEMAYHWAEVIFLCVGTPEGFNGEADMSQMEEAARAIARNAKRGTVVVEKSTVPAGTSERIRGVMAHVRGADDLYVVSNPEFLREGSAVSDTQMPDRIVVGAESERALKIMRQVYEPWANYTPLVETDTATAELAKHASNSFLAMKVSYANSLARLCDQLGADVLDVTRIMGLDRRIGQGHLNPGLGYGGYCFPKDVAALTALSREAGYDFQLLTATRNVNEETLETAFRKVREAVWNLPGKTIALLGLSFKAETDDVRYSPALRLKQRLEEAGAKVVTYDPVVASDFDNARDAGNDADCIVIGADWDEFRELDPPFHTPVVDLFGVTYG